MLCTRHCRPRKFEDSTPPILEKEKKGLDHPTTRKRKPVECSTSFAEDEGNVKGWDHRTSLSKSALKVHAACSLPCA